MVNNRFVYFTDPESGQVRRRYRDGAAFVAYGLPHDLGFWARHANIERFEDCEAGPEAEVGDVAVRVFLRSGMIEDNTDWPAPTGEPGSPPDLEFSGAGRMGDAFWITHPDVEEARISNHLGLDSMDQDCWLVRVWLKRSK